MARSKSALVLSSRDTGLIVVAVAVIAAAGWWSWNRAGVAAQAERRLRSKVAERRALAAAEPAASAVVAQRIEDAVADAVARREALQLQVAGEGGRAVAAAVVPTQRADAFFDIARFVEAERTEARRRGIDVATNEAFGFASHDNSGPEEQFIGVVHRQRLVTERLLGFLWEARPVALTRMERERPEAVLGVEPGGPAARSGNRDFFVPAEREAVFADHLDRMAFRVAFTGGTGVLRRFLNTLADADLTLIVRGIEVQPAGEARRGAAPRSLAELFRDESDETDNADPNVVIVVPGEAEFVVTVEYAGPRVVAASEPEGDA